MFDFFSSKSAPAAAAVSEATCEGLSVGPVAFAVSGGVALVGLAISMRRLAKQRFKSACERCFREVDADRSGLVSKEELYTAVLLVYLAINRAVRVFAAVKRQTGAAFDFFFSRVNSFLSRPTRREPVAQAADARQGRGALRALRRPRRRGPRRGGVHEAHVPPQQGRGLPAGRHEGDSTSLFST